jgi:hypothetical protein
MARAQDQELYVLAQSHARIHKERAMRRRKLKWLWARLKEIAAMDLDRGTAHEARRRTRQSMGGLASGQCRGRSRGRCLQLHALVKAFVRQAKKRAAKIKSRNSRRQEPV